MIFNWWVLNKRDLPWRRTRDPYKILLSEVMLQQTQVLRVIPKYAEFIEAYPTVDSLAKASTTDVLKIWRGMGYNRRALYLKKAAQKIVDAYNGEFPESEKELVTLPGLGTYTARAILVFAFGQDIAAVDTNIRQIITHFFFRDIAQKPSAIQEVADRLVPSAESWEWHQALMDYGALELPKHKRPERSRRTSQPFKETNRFYRGRVIDVLREGDVREFVLLKEFQEQFHKPAEFFILIIDGLVKDGLVERKKKMLRLPD